MVGAGVRRFSMVYVRILSCGFQEADEAVESLFNLRRSTVLMC